MIAPGTGKAFAVLFGDFRRWSVKSFYTIRWYWPASIIKPLSLALERKVAGLDRSGGIPSDLALVSLHFDGEMEPRDADITDFKGRLFLCEAGDVLYSKIDVRNGAIGVVPPSIPRAAVSSEYPVYRVLPDVALPQYVKLLFRTTAFRNQINSLISGASGRKRVQPGDLDEIEVPLPDPSVQGLIVDYWMTVQRGVDTAHNSLSEPVRSLNDRLAEVYRTTCTRDVIRARFFALEFKDLEAWDAKSGRAASFRLACPSFRPMGEFIEESTDLCRPSDEPDKDWPVYGVNNKEGVFLNSHQKGSTFNAPYKRIRKDWFFHNPTRCNVGSLGIVPDVPEDAITSPEYQVWRMKTDIRDPMLPSFVACLIQTPFFLDLVQFNRVGAVKQRMYTENLMQVRIPYLPVAEQQRYAAAREKALTALAAAKQRLATARKEVEAMILGTKKVDAP
jgi:hypothetical protein